VDDDSLVFAGFSLFLFSRLGYTNQEAKMRDRGLSRG
jgi:hypothetical protein